MRMLQKTIAIVLVLLIFALAASTSTVFAAESNVRYGREKLGEMANGSHLQYIYDHLVSGCGEAIPEITIDLSGRGADIANNLGIVYDMFYADYPEFFWVTGSWNAGIEQLNSTITLTVTPAYSMTGSTLSTARSAYDAKVNQLIAGLGGSDYDKAKTLHDRLIDTVTYVHSANDQTAYGALVEGKAVCNGYARAYQHLMMKAGIPAWFVGGTSINPSTGATVGHAWNLVKLDGQWYYTDVTWDDQGADTFYSFFNITTQQLLEEHTIGAQYANLVPNATATSANFYIKEGRIFDSYDQAKLAKLLKQDNNKTQIYVKGEVSSFMDSICTNLASLATELGATGSYQLSYGASQIGHGVIVEVIIAQGGHTHAAQKTVAQVNATCLASGTKAYYICDCGLRFSDQSCTQQITSDSQLEIKASEHTLSSWKNDAATHWKECSQCGSTVANTQSAHSDNNEDRQCDICNYSLPSANPETPGSNNTSGNSTGSQTPNQNSDKQGSGQTTAENTIGVESTDTTQPTHSTVPAQGTAPTENTHTIGNTDSTDSTTISMHETAPEEDSRPGGGAGIWLLIGGAVIVVAAGVAAAVIFLKKKNAKKHFVTQAIVCKR